MSCETGCRNDNYGESEETGSKQQGLLSRTNISRFIIATVLIIPIAVMVAVKGKLNRTPDQVPSQPVGHRALLSAVRELSLRGFSRQTVKEGSASKINTDIVNVTVILEHFELGPQAGGDGSFWMFSMGNEPFAERNGTEEAYFANTNFTWNSDGKGDTTCGSGGSGKTSRGYIDPFHNFLNLSSAPEYTHTVASLKNLRISEFNHINTVDSNSTWDTLGQAGDSRRYKHGVFDITEDDTPLLRASDVQWIQNLTYPAPAGASSPGVFELSAYFVAKVDVMTSNPEWVKKLDPLGLGYILGIVTGGSFGPPTCYTSNSYWVTLRGFPDFKTSRQTSNSGFPLTGPKKAGNYPGSPENAVAMARAMAGLASQAVTAVTVAAVGSSVASAAVAATGGQAPSPPSGGVVNLLKTAAFAAKLSQIPGFHTDTMQAFGSGLDPFLVRFNLPFLSGPKLAEVATRTVDFLGDVVHQDRDEESGPPPPSTISGDLFKGNAFCCTLIILLFALVQLCIWFATRQKPIEVRVGSQAWMVYLFSVIMSYIYTGSVLASMQYFRSNIPYGTGKAGIYFVAGCQLLLIGIGFTVFFSTIMVMALKQLRRDKVRWVPKQLLADPDLRRSATIAGEYEAGNKVWFHQLFQCYYNQMSGPRVWLAVMELSIVFIDALLTALVWNQIVCLSLLISLYASMLILFVALSPHRNKVQGILVILLVLTELLAFVFELIGSLGDFATAETCESGATILGFLAIAFAVVIAIYCDVIPTAQHFYGVIKKRYTPTKDLDLDLEENEQHDYKSASGSDWSGLYSSDGHSEDRPENAPGEYPRDSNALVAYNAEREARTDETLANIFDNRENGEDKERPKETSSVHDSAF